MSSDSKETVELWRYTTTSELMFLLEKSKLPTKPVAGLSVGDEIPEQDCIENIASVTWKELREVTEYAEWYVEPKIFRSTWDRFANATVALKSTKAALLSQVPNQTGRVEEVEYANIRDHSVRLPTDGSGKYPVDALGKLFAVKSSTFDHEQAMRVLIVPSGVLVSPDEMFGYSSLRSFTGSRPEINIQPDQLIQSIKISPNAPPYVGDVIETYLDEYGLGSLIS